LTPPGGRRGFVAAAEFCEIQHAIEAIKNRHIVSDANQSLTVGIRLIEQQLQNL